MIKPLEGHCLIKLDSTEHIAKLKGNFILPDSVERIADKIGILERYTPITSDVCKMWHKGKLRTFEGWHIKMINDQGLDAVGKRVCFETGRKIKINDVNYSIVRVEHITAILPDDAKVEASQGLQRCAVCKSHGEKNILLDDEGFCFQCGKNKDGRTKAELHDKWKLTDDEEYQLGNKGIRDKQNEKAGIAEEKKIMSYSGQKKRSTV